METAVRGMPLEYPPKPERLSAYGEGRWGGGRERVAGGQEGRGGDLWDQAGAEGLGEGVALSLSVPVFVSISPRL